MRAEMSRALVLLTLGATAWAACGGEEPPPPEYPPVEAPQPEPQPKTSGGAEPVDPALTHHHESLPPPPPPVQVVAGPRTPLEGAAPSVKISAPKNGATVKKGDVSVRLQVKNWKTEMGGNHIHLVLDNEPYIPVYDMKKPINLNQLVKDNLKKDLEPGTHVLRAFPGRPTHESVKDSTPFAWTVFHYQQKTDGFTFDPQAPLLTYSRPKGCVPIGERALLDFYLTNVPQLAKDGFRVKYTIDTTVSGEATDWVPYYIENLPAGGHEIRLTLVGKDGQPVAGPFNDTTRAIEVSDSCPPPPGHADHAATDEKAGPAKGKAEKKAAEAAPVAAPAGAK